MLRRHLRFLNSISSHIYSSDMIEKIRNIRIVDSTLREGEQFAKCNLNTHEKLKIANYLTNMRVDYIEVTSPIVSQMSYEDCKAIVKNSWNVQTTPRKTQILTHVRCHKDDIAKALECKVDGVNMYMATSPILAKYSHKKGIVEIKAIACDMVRHVKANGVEVRFSCEDSFRSDIDDIREIYAAVINAGANRIGVADTVGVADAYAVARVLRYLITSLPPTHIEFHCHNDTGSANECAFAALRYGATHIDTTVLGIGERNGITQLGAFLAKLSANAESLQIVKEKYNLKVLPELERYIATICNIDIPFNNPITGTAFTHKAGVHSNAVINNPSSYEIINPHVFGLDRNICVASKLTGKNAIRQRATELGINLNEATLIKITTMIKNIFDREPPNIETVDKILYANREIVPNVSIMTKTDHSSIVIKLIGHLFDKDIINNVANICTSNNVIKYLIDSHPGVTDEQESTAFVRIETYDDKALKNIVDKVITYINGTNYDGHACQISFPNEKIA